MIFKIRLHRNYKDSSILLVGIILIFRIRFLFYSLLMPILGICEAKEILRSWRTKYFQMVGIATQLNVVFDAYDIFQFVASTRIWSLDFRTRCYHESSYCTCMQIMYKIWSRKQNWCKISKNYYKEDVWSNILSLEIPHSSQKWTPDLLWRVSNILRK